jgi:hypothetical protein
MIRWFKEVEGGRGMSAGGRRGWGWGGGISEREGQEGGKQRYGGRKVHVKRGGKKLERTWLKRPLRFPLMTVACLL